MGKMMKNILKKLARDEEGQAFILVLIFLLVGGLITAPLLSYMSTGLLAGQMHEEKMDELYAADAGVEDALYKIINNDESLQNLDVGEESDPYYLTVNDLEVSYTVTKLSTLLDLLSEEELSKLKLDRDHADWIDFEIPENEVIRNYEEGWVEYTCNVTINYDGDGIASMDSFGAFFSRLSGNQSLIAGPYGYEGTETGVMDFTYLQDGSPETMFAAGSFTFIWRFEKGEISFDKDNLEAGFSFKFKINDPNWQYKFYFVWSTVTRQDISFATNAPGLYKWLIEATAGDTTVRSGLFGEIGTVHILAWEINPQ